MGVSCLGSKGIMAIKYELVLQEDGFHDDLKKDIKKKEIDFNTVKCQLLEDDDDYLVTIEKDAGIAWIHLAGRLVTVCLWAVLVSSLLVNVYFVWSPVSSWVTSSDFMIRGGGDLGDPARDDDYTLQEEQLKELGTLELLRREMEDIGNQEMARDYQDRSDWSWAQIDTLADFIKNST